MASVVTTVRATRLPVVVVLGATGTGKSKLALEIAVRFKGEIISADSMQVYKGLDIITNKVTPEEAALAPHHLLGFLDPLSRFTVTDFRNASLPLMERLLDEHKLPVVVGGTNYYIESLLWRVLMDEVPQGWDGKLVYERDKERYGCGGEKKRDFVVTPDSHSSKRSRVGDGEGSGGESVGLSVGRGDENGNHVTENGSASRGVEKSGGKVNKGDKESESVSGGGGGGGCRLSVWQGTDVPTDELYRRLQQVDPDVAATYHPNERRKIIRSLQVWEQTGRPHSHLLREQRNQVGGSGLGGALRYANSVILWLTCDQEVLLNRLDARVDEMIEHGLLKELLAFHASYNSRRLQEGGAAADYTKGIFQSIGFKEFHEFLILPKEERDGEKGRKLYEAGVAAMKLATRQYTKRQLRWIKNRFLTPVDRMVPPLYILDATDPAQWDAKVREPAESVVQAVMEGRVPDLKPANPPADPATASRTRSTKTRHECEVCQRVFIGEQVWLAHLRGAKHRKMLRRKEASQQQVQGKGKEAAAAAADTTTGS